MKTNLIRTAGEYGVYFDSDNQCFADNQMVIYHALNYAGYCLEAIAGIMGNIEAESGFSTAWSGHDGSAGICQWNGTRKENLARFAQSLGKDKTDIETQAAFIFKEASGDRDNPYRDASAKQCMDYLRYASPVPSVSTAADYFTALYERCHNVGSYDEAESGNEDRYSSIPNACNGRFYLDTPKRRGYASSYYSCLLQMQ